MKKLIIFVVFLTLFLIVGCARKNHGIKENNNNIIIHYIGDQSVFEN